MSVLNLTTSAVEAPAPSYDLSVKVEASSTLGLKSKLSLNSYVLPVVSEV